MSYRKVHINNKSYEYVIGKNSTKIKGVGVFSNSEYGSPFAWLTDKFLITPKHVTAMVLGDKVRIKYHCKLHNSTTEKVTYDPFALEINNRKVIVPNCRECIGNDI